MRIQLAIRTVSAELVTAATFEVVVATDSRAGEGVKVPIETLSMALGDTKPRSRRFGSLFHNVMMDSGFDANPVTVAAAGRSTRFRTRLS